MAEKYFLLPSKYGEYEIGSIFKYEGTKYVDIDTNSEPKYDLSAMNNWSQISLLEKNWLIRMTLTERLVCHRCHIFKKISELNTNQDCFYQSEKGKFKCKVKKREDEPEKVIFTIIREDGLEADVPLEDLELYSDANSEEMEDIIKLLLAHKGDIQKIDAKKRCVLSMVYKLRNKSYFQMMLNTGVELDINAANIQSLLRSIVNDKHLSILELVLDKCNIGPNSSTFLVTLAIEALRKGNNELLGVIFKFAQNINILENGETFLTNLYKENISEKTIINVVGMSLFDINIPSRKLETPLTLACERLWVNLVETLLDHGADAHYNNHKAFEVVIDAGRNHPEQMEEANRIKNLIPGFKASDTEKNVVIPPGAVNTAVTIGEPLDALEEIVLEIMRLLVTKQGDILNLNDKSSSVLTLSYNFPNKRLFNIFIHDYLGKFDVMSDNVGQSLLSQMVIDKEMHILKLVLDKCVHDDKYETFLLNLAISTLKKRIANHYKMIVDKCVDKNRETTVGEIFLTSCFKEKIEENQICDVIISKFFDINKSNASGQTALMLACERLMKDVVKVLIKNGCCTSYNNYRAIHIVTAQLDDDEEKTLSKNAILDLICGKVDEDQAVEELQFLENGFVNVNKIAKVKTLDLKFRIGDDVVINLNIDGGVEELTGEVKWLGFIDGEDCVGVQLDEAHLHGMDGVINADTKFECTPGHGVLMPIDNVQLNLDARNAHFLANNILDPHRYLKYHQNWNQGILITNNFKIDDIVCARLMNGDIEVNVKGILRWFGTMNNVPVGIIELNEPQPDGTNGLFWKYRLIRCAEQRAICVRGENIVKYIYKEIEIPMVNRVFAELVIGSEIIYYATQDGRLRDLYGKIRWTGVDVNQMYMYGIELDEEYILGTDGLCDGQRLFRCRPGCGVVASINKIAPDPNKNNENVPVTPPSRDSTDVKPCIPKPRVIRYGIQGNKNSSFLDCLLFSLFSTSDALDFMISHENNNGLIKNISQVIAFKVVYPLREFGFVSFHKTDELRKLIKEYRPGCGEITDKETNLENFAPVLKKLCRDDQLLSLYRENKISKAMFLNIAVINDMTLSCQQLLDIHMVLRDQVFEKIPTCLIINVPINRRRNGRVLPSNVIEISKLCDTTFKPCFACHTVASFQCKECTKNTKSIEKSLFCADHKCTEHTQISNCRESIVGSRSDISMHLRAVICDNGGKFVAYVKDDESSNSWIYYDDDVTGDPASPTITAVENIAPFIQKDCDEMVADLEVQDEDHLRRIAINSCVFVYLNSTKTCY